MYTINIILHTAGSINYDSTLLFIILLVLLLSRQHTNTQKHNLYSVIIILYNIDFRGKQMWYINVFNIHKIYLYLSFYTQNNENSFVISEF